MNHLFHYNLLVLKAKPSYYTLYFYELNNNIIIFNAKHFNVYIDKSIENKIFNTLAKVQIK